jgi:hypothetical protein
MQSPFKKFIDWFRFNGVFWLSNYSADGYLLLVSEFGF